MGWEEVKPFAEKYDNFHLCHAKVSISPQRVWQKDGKRGLSFKAVHLLIDCTEAKVEDVNPFDDIF